VWLHLHQAQHVGGQQLPGIWSLAAVHVNHDTWTCKQLWCYTEKRQRCWEVREHARAGTAVLAVRRGTLG